MINRQKSFLSQKKTVMGSWRLSRNKELPHGFV
jgi:hypothetical protein